MELQVSEPDPHSTYMVGHGKWMADDKTPQEILLDNLCGITIAALTKEGTGYELSRERISLGPYQGVQFVVRVPNARGKLIGRCYYADRRVVVVVAAGRRLEPDHPNVQKLFASVEALPPLPPPKP